MTPLFHKGQRDYHLGVIPFDDDPADYLAGWYAAKKTREMLKEVGW